MCPITPITPLAHPLHPFEQKRHRWHERRYAALRCVQASVIGEDESDSVHIVNFFCTDCHREKNHTRILYNRAIVFSSVLYDSAIVPLSRGFSKLLIIEV